jgi:hypothetical protein
MMLELPSGLKEINKNAFGCCSTYFLKEGYYIEVKDLFDVKYIGCENLKTIKIPESVNENIYKHAFANCQIIRI